MNHSEPSGHEPRNKAMSPPGVSERGDGLPLDPGQFQSLLVVKPSSLGDIIHALPAVALLAEACPRLRIRWVVRPEFASLLGGLAGVCEPILFPRDQFRGIGGWWRALGWARDLRHSHDAGPEMILDLQGLLRSGVISRVRRRAGDQVVGLGDAREGGGGFHQVRLPVDAGQHAVRRLLGAVSLLGARVPEDEFDLPWSLPAGDLPDWWCGPSDQGGYVVLHPYARGKGKALDEMAINHLVAALDGTSVVVVGRRSGAEVTWDTDGVIDATNRTSLTELIAILRGASGVISVDSGPAHLAAAVCPGKVISIHSWADPRRVGPWRADARAWYRGDLKPMRQWMQPDGAAPTSGAARLPSEAELRQIASEIL